MKDSKFPYGKFEALAAWNIVNDALEKLVQNGDLTETTDRRYIAGYILNKLVESGVELI